ncbi:HesA/MoeB/ThiF family protein [Desulfuromonas acetoxidans]|uniref:UBA/THIF-type NAD/FAD binding fold n=1 Tax=Desulfuromonas acetoxidans (strain DSM 684 / 11070) TaxID=281689 RepID=Q1JWU8_DESA6|nr:HesA/MoeB/ThiF family protein [Desulfuromonas acetoxidans]EAT14696.1 UBA/THIF-type NAD/FAD binding fold [Desulfuromonas acetoxidans DSM 684]MBF0646306.1 HesA/MoeB/ThiF family protein [Desulfuromonas acetoxidans]NVD25115.1 HesA/MoeB/ThiF family protein [Desulfuromonas acetoxidans]NVE17264.1 HesA/MoeB/ThiF family protein [Desulfuromonas acetoxidans]
MCDVQLWIENHASSGLLSWADQQAAAKRFNVSVACIEAISLKRGILPTRYQRNGAMLSCHDQLCLFSSHVAVVGCGGLGGFVVEELARLGVGHITIIDPDVFEEHNLNRQLFSSTDVLGCDKVTIAAQRIAQVNPATVITPKVKEFRRDNGIGLLAGAQVVVDALDSIATRLELAEVCRELEVPLVHGAIGGWYGHVTTLMPEHHHLEQIYQQPDSRGIEKKLGNPSFTPAVIASLQVAEVSKLLLDRGDLLDNRLLMVDLLDMELSEISF